MGYTYIWFVEDEKLVRDDLESGKLEYFDRNKNQWIHDWSLSEIYTGDVRAWWPTEDQAMRILAVLKTEKDWWKIPEKVREIHSA